VSSRCSAISPRYVPVRPTCRAGLRKCADAVLFDIRYGMNFKVGARSRPATDQEIELVARTIVERLQQANWVIETRIARAVG